MKIGDLVKSAYSKNKGIITQDLGLWHDPRPNGKKESRRFKVMLLSTGSMCTFRSYELKVISESR